MKKDMDQPENRPRGRPRDEKTHRAILLAALSELKKSGFRTLTMDQIADAAKVGKMTIYRRWPNKATLVMDAFLEIIGPGTEFPEAKTVIGRIQKQLLLQTDFFNGQHGQIVKALIGEAQFNEELEEAFLNRWLRPRRAMTQKILELGVEKGELSIDNYDLAIDLLYGPFYYRLILKSAKLDKTFALEALRHWLKAFGKP